MFQRLLNNTAKAGNGTGKNSSFMGLPLKASNLMMLLLFAVIAWQLAASMNWVSTGPLDMFSSLWNSLTGKAVPMVGQGGMPVSTPRLTPSGVLMAGSVTSSNGVTKTKEWNQPAPNALVASGPKFGYTVVSTAGFEPLIKTGRL